MKLILSILMDAFFIALLIWCSYTDLKRRLISNKVVVILLSLSIIHAVYMTMNGSMWWQYPAGLILAVPFFIAWLKDGMGAGDVKLVMAMALYLGLTNTVFAFTLMIPIITVLMMRSLIRNRTVKCRIPFAPVVSIGAVGIVLTGYVYALLPA